MFKSTSNLSSVWKSPRVFNGDHFWVFFFFLSLQTAAVGFYYELQIQMYACVARVYDIDGSSWYFGDVFDTVH